MMECRGDLDLAQEPVDAEHGGQVGLEDLERDLAVVLEVVGEVDGRHAPLAQLPLDAVAVGERGVNWAGASAMQNEDRDHRASKRRM